jgi:chemotaxis protein methyltransferase CheR
MSAAFAEIAAHIQARSGLALGPEKLYLLETRLAPILRREKLADLRALAQNISRNETLSRAVVEAMTTNESRFFPDNKPFKKHRDVALAAPGHQARSCGSGPPPRRPGRRRIRWR